MTVRLAYNPGPVNAYNALAAPTVRLAFNNAVRSSVWENPINTADKPDVRLAFHPEGDRTLSTPTDSPTVRLALANSPPERNGTSGLEAPTVRLATTIDGGGSMGPKAFDRHLAARDDRPALLVSYVYLKPFLTNRARYHYRDWVLDSGAFSAHASGVEISLQDYIDTAKQLLETDPTLTEVFALDVIGDWKGSLRNVEEMWRQGVPAIPCYHVGEPEDVLKGLARDYPKVALGGAVGYKGKDKWAAQCFSRIWPKPVHGFGFGSEKSIMADLYQGSYFTVCLRWALSVTQPENILILSAKHGFLKLNQIVAPYSVKMGEPGCITPAAITDEQRSLLKDPVYVAAGEEYIKFVKQVHPEAIGLPLIGRMGPQMKQLNSWKGRLPV